MTMINQQQQQVNTQTNIANASGRVYTGTVQIPPTPVIRSLHQIPAPPDDFVGREEELAAILTHFERGATITGLRGMGGVGKTTLAFKVAQRLEASYPDAQLYVHLRGASSQPLTAVDAMQQILRAFHPDARLPEQEAELLNCYRSALHGQRVLLLLDDAADRAQVEPLLPPAGCAVLITSRQTFALPGLKTANLDTLPPDKARALLLEIAAQIGDYADELAQACGYLPLALRAVGSALAERPDLHPAEYARRLQDARTRLSLIDASLTLSYDLLSPDLQARWAALAVFPFDFDALAAAAIWELDPDAARDALSDLLRYSLVQFVEELTPRPPLLRREGEQELISPLLRKKGEKTESGEAAVLPLSSQERGPGGEFGRYRLHDLARVFASAQLPAVAAYAASARHAAYYDGVLRTAKELYKQGYEHMLAGLALFDQEWPNIREGQQWAAAHAANDDAAACLCSDYPDAGLYVLDLRLSPRQRISWLDAGLMAARHLHNRAAEGAHLGNLGIAYRNLGEMSQAIEQCNQWLEIAREIRDRQGESNALGNLGAVFLDLNEVRQAIKYYEQQLEIAHDIGDQRGKGNALGGLGVAYRNLGETYRAIELCEQWLAIACKLGDRWAEGSALGILGNAYADLEEVPRAIKYYEQHIKIAREINDRRGEGAALWNLSLALDKQGNRAEAITCATTALTIREQIEDPNADKVRWALAEWRQ